MVPTEPPEPPESDRPTEDLSRFSSRVSVGRYEIRGELGSGAMGTVWRAHDTWLDREVAVKEVHLPHDMPARERERARARMIREAQATARITHPSVVTVHDVLEVDGVPFIVMELLEGESLRDRLLRSGPMTEREVEQVAHPLVEALWTAHKAGVVHRDVKPANIMLTSDGARPVLTDFGIANLPDHGGTALTGTGAILGTAAYAAPERLEHDDNGAVSDLWSLGATLFAALTGESPFKRDTLTATLTAVLTQPVPPVPARGRSAAVIGGLLERDPRRRLLPERALALLEAPEPGPGASGPRPSGASSGYFPSGPAKAPAPARRSARGPLLVGGGAVAALLVLSSLALWLFVLSPSDGDASVADGPSESPSESPSEEPSPSPSVSEGPTVSSEEAPEGFVRHEDGVVSLVLPEDWEVRENEEDEESETSTRLASYVVETGVEAGTVQIYATRYDMLLHDAEGAMQRMDEMLNEDEAFSDVERLVLEPEEGENGFQSAVYEALFHHGEREVPERWMFTREITDESSGTSYRLSFNFPAHLRDEHRDDFELILDSFAAE